MFSIASTITRSHLGTLSAHRLSRHLVQQRSTMPNTYQAVEEKEWAPKSDLASGIAVAERPVPAPGAGEVLVRLFLRPINPSDVTSLGGSVTAQPTLLDLRVK